MTRGFTLVELLVTLVLLGVTFGLAAGAVTVLDHDGAAGVPERLAAARLQATRTGAAVVLRFDDGTAVTVFPDGSATPARVTADGGAWDVDPWTAEARRVSR